MTFMEIARIGKLNGFNPDAKCYDVEKLIRPLSDESKQIIYKMLDFVINFDSLEEDAIYILNKEYNKKLVEFFRYKFVLQFVSYYEEGRGI